MCMLPGLTTRCEAPKIPKEVLEIQSDARQIFKECLGYDGDDAVRFVEWSKEPISSPMLICLQNKITLRLRAWRFSIDRPRYVPSDEFISYLTCLYTKDDPYGGVIIDLKSVKNHLEFSEDEFYKRVFKISDGWANFNFPDHTKTVDVVFKDDDIESFRRHFKSFLLN